MAYRYTDPDTRTVYRRSGGFGDQQGKTVKFWADSAGTVPIDVGLYSESAPSTPGASTGANTLNVQADQMWPAMWDRVGANPHMWIQVGTASAPGDLYKVFADADQRLSALESGIEDLSGVTDAAAARAALGAAESGVAQIAPSMTVYEPQAEPLRKVLYHNGTTIYAATQDSTGTVSKSTDLGATWTTKGNLGFNPHVLMRIEATGTLIAIAPNPTATVKRSTDDGATWTTVTTLNFAPLNGQGITETPSGYLLVGEYGNVGSTVYRIMRSTDDGQTFTAVLSSSGTAPVNDPGHVHSVTYDKVAAKFVAFLDYSQPQLFSSADQGATWSLIATSNTVDKPNFTAPMYFPNYVAWGYDNENNGKIARLPRADFYAGNWAAVEQVAQVTKKAFYGAFPIAEGVWVVSQATETIGTVKPPPGSYSQEIYIVDDDGGRVSGGVEHTSPSVKVGALLGQKAMMPAFNYNSWDHSGVSWLNLNAVSAPREFTAVPYSVGSRPAMPKTFSGSLTHMVLAQGQTLRAFGSSGPSVDILAYDSANNRTSLRNFFSPALPEVRLYEGSGGPVAILFNGALAFSVWTDGRVRLEAGYFIELGSNGPRIRGGAGSPEGVVASPVGSLYLRSDGGAGTALYVKESGTGSAGWAAK